MKKTRKGKSWAEAEFLMFVWFKNSRAAWLLNILDFTLRMRMRAALSASPTELRAKKHLALCTNSKLHKRWVLAEHRWWLNIAEMRLALELLHFGCRWSQAWEKLQQSAPSLESAPEKYIRKRRKRTKRSVGQRLCSEMDLVAESVFCYPDEYILRDFVEAHYATEFFLKCSVFPPEYQIFCTTPVSKCFQIYMYWSNGVVNYFSTILTHFYEVLAHGEVIQLYLQRAWSLH